MGYIVKIRAICLSESIINRKSKRVVRESIGTFVDVLGETMILTCYHGIDNMLEIGYQYEDMEYSTTMVKSIPEYDIAFLKCNNPKIKGLSIKTKVFDDSELKVYTTLFGNEIEINCKKKWKWSCRKHNSKIYPKSMFIDVNSDVFRNYEDDLSGMSGSPILSDEEIVGIMSYSHKSSICFTHSSVIKLMIDSSPIKTFPISTQKISINGYEGLLVDDTAKVKLDSDKKSFKFLKGDIIMKVNDSVIEGGNVWCGNLDAYVPLCTCALVMKKIGITIIRNREIINMNLYPANIEQLNIMPYLPTRRYWSIDGFVFTDMSEEIITEYSSLYTLTNAVDLAFYKREKSICLIDIDRSVLSEKILNKVDKLGLPLIENNDKFTIPVISKIDKVKVTKIEDIHNIPCSKIVLKAMKNININVENEKIVSLN